MIIIIAGLTILLLGIIAVAWVLLTDKKTTASPQSADKPRAKPARTTAGILNEIESNPKLFPSDGSEPPDRVGALAEPGSRAPAPKFLNASQRADMEKSISQGKAETQGTAALRLASADKSGAAETQLSQKNEELEKQIAGINQKNATLETLLQEKNAEIERLQKELEAELQSRKEFNKVKDILEKELKDSKEKNRTLQIDLTNAQTEAEAALKRVTQLDEKTIPINSAVKEKERLLQQHQDELQASKAKLQDAEDRLRKLESSIPEKDEKINTLVPLLKDLPEISAAAAESTVSKTPPPSGGNQAKENDKERPAVPSASQEAPDPDAGSEKPGLPRKEKPADDIEKIRQLTLKQQDTPNIPVKAAPGGESPAGLDAPHPDTVASQERTAKDLLNSIESDITAKADDVPAADKSGPGNSGNDANQPPSLFKSPFFLNKNEGDADLRPEAITEKATEETAGNPLDDTNIKGADVPPEKNKTNPKEQ